ncbi:helix-turn-helix transcriptional regulator [Sphaerisporangium album]|uniref:Helix-turn-helix transcriptional regulator n=1 Tax=Sphaerisporangium album TaxID=509200 RepID=A0A367EKQ3_9ACTN|nr:LuxR family transcriptional regulator [Sphaerisporangium album]RCG17770.1 helix-turn-helix transcriptional regulator [Sphaerisporangium album]
METLVGREAEIERLDALVEAARQGRGGALAVCGEPGMGKSTLLRRLAERASGFLVVQASGAEFEIELPFAALHQVCMPMLGRLEELPPPHRRALEIAFGLATGPVDPFLVGVATLGLMAETARGRPLLCLIDDAQWLDDVSAKALAFLARRIADEPVALVFATREAGFGTVPGLTVGRLRESEARTLLAQAVRAPLDERVRDRILAESRGNPLALLELPRSAGLAGMAGGFDVPAPDVIEQSFRVRLALLPPRARLLVTVAAADPVGDPGLLWRAADLLGIERAATAEAGELVEFGTRIRFSHPLARSAAYAAAPPEERRRAHAALAEATDPVADPDRRAWHHAQAAIGPDEEVAAALMRSAARAQARGGVAAAAAFLRRAATLTPDPALRVDRVLAAAEAELSAGAFDAAAELLSTAETSSLDGDLPARIDLLRGRLSFVRHRGGEQPTAYLLRAAERLASADRYLDAMEMGLLLGDLGPVVQAARTATVEGPVLEGVIRLTTQGHRAGAELLLPVLADAAAWSARPSLGFMLAAELWAYDAMRGIAEHVTTAGRESGSFHMLPIGLAMQASAVAHAGEFGAAMEMISEEEAIAEATGAAPLVYPRIHLAALRGRRAEAFELFAKVDPRMTLSVQWAAAVLHNGLGNYQAALEAARTAVAHGHLGMSGLALPELVEAAVRCGAPAIAESALADLSERTQASGDAWGLGVAAYARALVTGDEEAYREAIDHLDGGRPAVSRARAHLLYGEWLRRQGRRREAREHLRTAHEALTGMGAEAFAERAAGELRATGEQARSRSSQASEQLTVQEVHIARLVADGATSKEVAATLFLSPRTVDAHLRNIFRKLGLTSRRQLRDLADIRG